MSTDLNHITHFFSSAQNHLLINGLFGASKGLILSQLKRKSSTNTLLVITPTSERANELFNDCSFFFDPDDLKHLKLFPADSILPFSRLSPEPEDVADKLWILYQLLSGEPLVIIAPITSLMRRLPPKKFIAAGSKIIRAKDNVDPFELTLYLTNFGYEDVGLVEDEGSFARRGGIIDMWPPSSFSPVRIELDEEKIVSMRFFDPATQRSRKDTNEIILIPVRDVPLDDQTRKEASTRIRERAESTDLPTRERRTITEALNEGIAFAGIETFLTLFHESVATIFDYLPTDARIIVDDEVDTKQVALAHFEEILALKNETQSPERIINTDEIIIPPEAFDMELTRFPGMRWNAFVTEEKKENEQINIEITSNAEIRTLISSHKENEDMLSPLILEIKKWQASGMKIVFTCHTELQAARLTDLFHAHDIELSPLNAPFGSIREMSSSTVHLRQGRISKGFRWPQEKIAVITDEEIFGSKVIKRTATSKPMEPFTSFAEITEGDYIVHEQHGIGRYKGLVNLEIEGKANDYLLLEYLGGDKLYLPVYRLNLVGRYIGSADAPPLLDKLGSLRFSQVQKKVDRAIMLIARELLALNAAREVYPGFPFPLGGTQYEEFSAAFPYDETPDQARAIDDVMRDMGLERPMDRLICGDVGYGKTEVAMRAAFRAVMSGKQVAVLVPTTVLALQHYETFTRRFGGTPVIVEMLSRFKTGSEQKTIVESLKRGNVDIIIGTHRLLQKDVSLRDLGLLIIDEEHRFGVVHKERIKKLRSTVDVITLTATPIPRTLNLSLIGIRDISVINTPPADRLSIATYVVPFDEAIIRQSILKELARGGQVFFVHNRVETIRSMHDRLKRLIPEARIVVGHGQLKEGELERVMIEFLKRKADVLLCTTIIESGLDIPTANTIIIHRADTFGLAQLYQLRGRVGRSNLRASAYLLIPEEGKVTPIAAKRLSVLKRFTELGSGFQIAMHDLEFRGAGNILGSAQSGHITAVGYEMYTKLLDRAISRLKGKVIEEEIDPELHLKVAAFLPESYIADPGTRIDLYRRLASRENAEEIDAIGEELTDRFGILPTEAVNLLGVMEVKMLAKDLKMRQIVFDGTAFSCQLDASTPLTPQNIMDFAAKEILPIRLVPPDRLIITAKDKANDADILKSAKNSLSRLKAYVSHSS